jgi:hypothetical protein
MKGIRLRDAPKVLIIAGLGAAFISLGGGLAILKAVVGDDSENSSIHSFLHTISGLDGLQLSGAAIGIGALGAALVAFSAGNAIGGFIDGIRGFFGGGKESPLDRLIIFSKRASALKGIGDGFEKIVNGLRDIKTLGDDIWSGLLNVPTLELDAINEQMSMLLDKSDRLSANLKNTIIPQPRDTANAISDSAFSSRGVVVVNNTNVVRGGDTTAINSMTSGASMPKRQPPPMMTGAALGFYNS